MKTIQQMIEVMKAFADGKEIECLLRGSNWYGTENPDWNWWNADYRIVEKKKELVPHWPAICMDESGGMYLSDDLFSDTESAKKVLGGGIVSKWVQRRKQPYMLSAIRHLKCVRCGAKAFSQWSVCADQNNYRPLCKACDIALNKMVLNWMGHPRAKELASAYKAKMEVES
jgi:hypothetical protein